jgi:hypothetical protein
MTSRFCGVAMRLIAFVVTTAAMTFFAICAEPALAQDKQSLAREVKNPFANLTNLQFFYDANLNTGPEHKTQDVLNIRPVIPFAVSPDWSLITRTLIPVIAQPGSAPGDGWTSGPGDTLIAAYLSPSGAEHFVWGLGPVFQIPTATNDALGQGKWGAGPAAGALWIGEQWSVGALINNVWSVGGDHSRPAVNQMQFEPQITYNFRDNPDRYLTFAPTIVANWKASGGERWTVPLTLGIGQLFKFGKQSVNLQAAAYYNVIKPTDAGNWTLELTVQFLFPK